MKLKLTPDGDRGQVGIGTLIVFIAMVLVAAIAAGVLINTAGFLQSKSEAAGQQSGQQVTNRIQVVSATGTSTGSAISQVNMTVKQAPGAGDVNLENVTAQWVTDDGTSNVVADSVSGTAAAADGTFAVTPLKDADGSSTVLNDPDDRFVMTFDIGGSTDGPATTTFGTNIGEGESVTVKMSTQSGGTVTERLIAPETLSSTSAVSL
jgi:flagellin FlaB